MLDKNRHEMGPGGYCFCPRCETRIPHSRGIPCQDRRCATCGAKLLREGSRHHELLKKKRAS